MEQNKWTKDNLTKAVKDVIFNRVIRNDMYLQCTPNEINSLAADILNAGQSIRDYILKPDQAGKEGKV